MRIMTKIINAYWEYKLNIRTRGVCQSSIPGTLQSATLDYYDIWRLFSVLNLKLDDVFVDIGCGRGRILCCAATFQLNKCIGIEIDDNIANQARYNALCLKNKLSPVEIITDRAENYDYVTGNLFFLFNPFKGEPMSRFLEKLKFSLIRWPRTARIVYVYPIHAEMFDQCDWLIRDSTMNSEQALRFGSHKGIIWRTIN